MLLARTRRWLGGVTPLGFEGEKETIITEDGKTRREFEFTARAAEDILKNPVYLYRR